MSAAALILAAGEGTRMKSDLPKVAHRILGVPLIRLVVDAAREAGLDPIVVVVGHQGEIVRSLVPGERVVVQEEQLGTGHAVACAMDAFDGFEGSLVVLSGDSPLIKPETMGRLVELREETGAAVSLLTTHMDDPTGYGRIIRDDDGELARIIEHKDLDESALGLSEVNTGTYCFDTRFLRSHLGRLKAENTQNEYYLTDMVQHLRDDGLPVAGLQTEDPAETLGVNSRVQLSAAAKVLQRRLNEAHMLAGVTMTDPDLVWVSPGVRLGRDVVIEPMTTLLGDTSVGDRSVIGPSVRIVDSQVGEDARIDSALVVGSRIGDRAGVGPFAHLRPGTVLEAGARVGTYVELKNSTVGEGSKVPHLSYMGDASIGAGVNVGAGSITCNYDGRKKSPTVIEAGAFIGSDTMLVAPVRVGENAVTGAGSVITHDVPPGALAVERVEQRHVEGWAERRKDADSDDSEK